MFGTIKTWVYIKTSTAILRGMEWVNSHPLESTDAKKLAQDKKFVQNYREELENLEFVLDAMRDNLQPGDDGYDKLVRIVETNALTSPRWARMQKALPHNRT